MLNRNIQYLVSSIQYIENVLSMFKGRTLLERFRDPRSDEQLTLARNTAALADSILQHLTRMLNTRRGGPLIHPDDYGMIDLSDVINNYPDSISDVQKAIRTAIDKYEPRLRDVRVEYVESGEDILTLKFKITARIALEKGRELVSFETFIKPTGQVQVNG